MGGTQCGRGGEVHYDSGGDSHELGTEEDGHPFDNPIRTVGHQCVV